MQGYQGSTVGQHNMNVNARPQRSSHAVVSLLALAVFVLSIVSTATGKRAVIMDIMVCKGGPAIYFSADIYAGDGRIKNALMLIHFNKSKGKTDPTGRNLRPGECGLLGQAFHSRHESTMFTRESEWQLTLGNGKMEVQPQDRRWIHLRKKNKITQIPVRIVGNGVRFCALQC